MSRTRAQANQSLYQARILLSAWGDQREAGRLSDKLLTQTFLPAVRLHLRESYGWFLLAVSGVENSERESPPEQVSDVESPEAGKVRAPELRELELLETSGWLADVLDNTRASEPSSNGAGLLVSDHELPGLAVATQWADRWSETMARMEDSLAEC